MGQPSTAQLLPPRLPVAGERVGERYLLRRRLGEGGMGVVFEATDDQTGLSVAVKVMLPEEGEYTAARRFTRETQAVRAISSEHVACVLDVGEVAPGMPFLVMELLVGEPLDDRIKAHAPLPIVEAVDLLLQACDGLAHAHALGIVHRDLKPANLFVVHDEAGKGRIKVLDFGIAKATAMLDPGSDELSLTETRSTLGSPQYMSPEQLRDSKNVDARADIWSLGLVLFKMLTGRPAFDAQSVGQHFAMIMSDAPTPLRARRPDAPVALQDAILCCLQKDREYRYQDVGQLAEALAPFGPPGARERVGRIQARLDDAGAAATTRPGTPPVPPPRGSVASATAMTRRDAPVRSIPVERAGDTLRANVIVVPRKRRWAWYGAGAIGLGVAGVAVAWVGFGERDTAPADLGAQGSEPSAHSTPSARPPGRPSAPSAAPSPVGSSERSTLDAGEPGTAPADASTGPIAPATGQPATAVSASPDGHGHGATSSAPTAPVVPLVTPKGPFEETL